MFTSAPGERDPWLDRAAEAGASKLRIDVGWPAASRPANPVDPADPAYDFRTADASIKAAAARGFGVLASFTYAPPWAEGANRPRSVTPGSWRPNPAAIGAYGQALARRYSGSYPDPAAPGATLPRVAAFQMWNEPNLGLYLSPQWTRKGKRYTAAAPAHYRRMLNAFYAGVKRSQPSALVVTAGTAPFGDLGHRRRMPPARFVRELLRKPVRFDVLSHHPYSVGGPFRRALNRDDVSLPDMGKLSRPLRRAERAGRALPRGRRHRLWVTEVSWDSSPPDPQGVPSATHARWTAQALYVLWRQGVDSVFWFQVGDRAPEPSFSTTYQSGLYLRDGRAKSSRDAFRFPLVIRPKVGAPTLIWTRIPRSGEVQIQRKIGGSWRVIARKSLIKGHVWSVRRKLPRHYRIRAVSGPLTSRVSVG